MQHLLLALAFTLFQDTTPPPPAPALTTADLIATGDAPLSRRLRAQLGPVTMRVSPGRIERLRDGKVWTTNWYGQPLDNALAYALRLSEPGEVIGLSGEHPGFRAGGTNDSKGFEAVRPRDPATGKRPPIPECAIVRDDGADIPAIFGVSITGTDDDTDGGIEGITFHGIDIVTPSAAPNHGKCAVIVEQFKATGYLRFWNCDFTRESDPNAWQGWGKMWAVRAHGVLTYLEMVECVADDALEHALAYADNLGRNGDTSRFIACAVTGRGGGRTCIQAVNRVDSAQGDPARYGGGRVVIDGCDLRCIGGNGGGAITFASSGAHILIRDTKIEVAGPHNGIMVWINSGNGGLITNAAGFAHEVVVLDGVTVRGGNRPHIAVSAAERVVIRNGFRITASPIDGGRNCFDFGVNGVPAIANGEILFRNLPAPLSAYDGFQSGAKVRVNNAELTANQLDKLLVMQPPGK